MSARKSITTLATLVVIGLLGITARPAQASLAPANPVVTGGGGTFTYTYGTDLSGAEKVQGGDFLTISGIHNYIAGSAFSNALFTPVVTTVADVTSITWTATGATAGPTAFDFGFDATSALLGIGSYAYQDHGMGGAVLFGSGTVQVPISITPEPATFVSFGLCALVVVGLMLFNRNRRASLPRRAVEAFA
jgi:hypothetical protein